MSFPSSACWSWCWAASIPASPRRPRRRRSARPAPSCWRSATAASRGEVFTESLMATVKTTCMVALIIICAQILSTALTYSGVSRDRQRMGDGAGARQVGVLRGPGRALHRAGMLRRRRVDDLHDPAVLLPVVKAFGFDLIWFGVILTVLIELGQITPPVGLNLFTIHAISGGAKFSEVAVRLGTLRGADADRYSHALPVARDRAVAPDHDARLIVLYVKEEDAMARRNSSDYAVVWPRSAKAVEIKPLAKRLDTLDGKTIAFLWDDLFRGDEIWPILKEELSSRFTDVNFIDHDAFGSTHGDEEHRVLGRAAGEDQVDEDRRGRLRHGVLRKLHTRRVAGQRDCRTGRRAHLLAVLRGLPGPGQDDVGGAGLSQPRARDRAGPCRRADVGRTAGQRARHDGRPRDPQPHGRDRRGAGHRRSRSAGHRVRGQLRGGQPPVPGERLERRPADRAADQGEDRRVPGLHRSAARPCDRQAACPTTGWPRCGTSRSTA